RLNILKTRSSRVRIKFLDKIDNKADHIIPPSPDLDPQNTVGEFEADLRVTAEIVRKRCLAVAARSPQCGGDSYSIAASSGEDRVLEPAVFIGAGYEIIRFASR